MTESRSPLSSFYPLLLLHTHPHTHTCTCCFKVPPPPSIFSHEFYHRIVKVARTALRNKVKVSPLFQGVTADSHSRNFPSAPHPSDTFPPFPSSLRPSPPPRSFRYLFSRNYFANESLASVSTRFECGARRNYAHWLNFNTLPGRAFLREYVYIGRYAAAGERASRDLKGERMELRGEDADRLRGGLRASLALLFYFSRIS